MKYGIGKLACLKVDIGKTLGKLPWMSEIPLQGNGMAAIPKIFEEFNKIRIKIVKLEVSVLIVVVNDANLNFSLLSQTRQL